LKQVTRHGSMLPVLHDQVVDAIMSEDEALLHECMENGLCDVSTRYRLENELNNLSGITPLHFACFQVKPNAARILLDIEGPFDQDSDRGISELRACLAGHIERDSLRDSEEMDEIITFILLNGIDVRRLEDDFHNLIGNIMPSARRVMRIFLRHSDFFRHPSNFARHPFASIPGNRGHPVRTFECLMSFMHVHETDRSGRTALNVIAERVRVIDSGVFFMIQRLLGQMVNPNVRDPGTNLTPFSTVVKFRRFMGPDADTLRLRLAVFLLACGAEFEVPAPTEIHPQLRPRELSWYERVYAIDPRRPLTMALAFHPRLGNASEIQRLPTEVQRTICDTAFEEYHRMHQRN
jgi:hypothetical protein